jgi:hypothetical protein
MSAMEQMALSVLQKLIPKEVLTLFTKENVDLFVGNAREFKERVDQNLQSIADEQASQRAMLEELLNERHTSKRKPGRGSPAASADTGTGTE